MRALIVLIDDYIGVARLPGALVKAGFTVAALCHARTFLASTRHLTRVHPWPKGRHRSAWLAALATALTDATPDVVIPGDQRAAALLLDIAAGTLADPILAPHLDLLRASLGAGDHGERCLKIATCAAARALGCLVPAAETVTDAQAALAFAAREGWPVVLKRDFGASAEGVQICPDAAAVARAWTELTAKPRPRSLVRRLAGKLRGRFLTDWTQARPGGVQAMRHVTGRVAGFSLTAWRGETLAAYGTLREQTHPAPLGPSSVVRFLDHPGMAATAAALAQRWQASGFLSFDFILDDDDRAWLLECNPRPVPTTHLAPLAGADLCGALAAAIAGRPPPPPPPRQAERVALFPQEWRRDSNSRWLREAHHDVPWDDPPLLRRLVDAFATEANAH
jgi:carbamoyl-phosphate synthase large subunit